MKGLIHSTIRYESHHPCVRRGFSATVSKSDTYVRNAQAAEIFRSSFFNSKNRDSIIPLEDLDQLVVREKVRPSLFTTALQISGAGLGTFSRFIPESVGNVISSAVDDASVQQFNDSIREMQLQSVDNIDVKETLKYHRELRGTDSDVSNENNTPPSPSHILDAKGALTTILYHSLKITGKY